MSKVKGNIYDLNKTKLRGNLRRIETKKKKNERLQKARNHEYSMGGYYVKDEKVVGQYKLVHVPEQIVDDYHWERSPYVCWEDGKPYTYMQMVKVVTGKKVIPAHTKKVAVSRKWVSIPERPVRINTNLKSIRKTAERKVRNTDGIYNGGSYKKVYELKWNYW